MFHLYFTTRVDQKTRYSTDTEAARYDTAGWYIASTELASRPKYGRGHMHENKYEWLQKIVFTPLH